MVRNKPSGRTGPTNRPTRRALLATLGAGELAGCSELEDAGIGTERDPETPARVRGLSGTVSGSFRLPHTLERPGDYRPRASIAIEGTAGELRVLVDGTVVDTLEDVSGEVETDIPFDAFGTGENTVAVEAGDHRAELGTVSYALETPHELRIRPFVDGTETDLPEAEVRRSERLVDDLDAHSQLPDSVRFYDKRMNVAELHETHWNNFEIISEESELDVDEIEIQADLVRNESRAANAFREAILDEDAYREVKENPVEVPYSNHNPTYDNKLGGSYQDIRDAESGFDAFDSALRLFLNMDKALAPGDEVYLVEGYNIIPHTINWAVNTQTDYDIHAWAGSLDIGGAPIGWAYIRDSDEFRQFEVLGESDAATFHNGYKEQLNPRVENTSYIFNDEWYDNEEEDPEDYRHPLTFHYEGGMINPHNVRTTVSVEKDHFTDVLRGMAATEMEWKSDPRLGQFTRTCPLTNELARELSASLLTYNSNDVEFDDVRTLAYVMNQLESTKTDYAIELAEERTGEYHGGFRPYKFDTGEPLAVSFIATDIDDRWNDIGEFIEENPHDAFGEEE